VAQPLLLGGALAGAPSRLLRAYDEFGLALGEAFQLRDDVLGVFGDPAATGKPAGDDLREGKRTVLVASAMEAASPAQEAQLRRSLGDPRLGADGVERLRSLMVETGALATVERLITSLCESALTTLAAAELDPDARTVLERLVVAATARDQ
jgi:geranylgeranyl diphosphate synthase, type I